MGKLGGVVEEVAMRVERACGRHARPDREQSQRG
jgi:hypothetical protein